MPDIFTAPKRTEKNIYHHQVKRMSPAAKRSTLGILSTFIQNPDGITFAEQEKNEQVLLFTRRHFASNFFWIAISLIASVFPLLVFLTWRSQEIFDFSFKTSFLIILTTFYYLIIIGYVFYNFVDWFYNIGIITQKRMIDIDFTNLSVIDIAATKLEELEDTSFTQKGFFASWLDYGDVIARTAVAGKEELFIFEKVPHPEKVVDLISKVL